jgi:hypothetical protein
MREVEAQRGAMATPVKYGRTAKALCGCMIPAQTRSAFVARENRCAFCANAASAPDHAQFEYVFRRDREAIGDIGRAVGDFEQMAAKRTAALAGAAAQRAELDPAKSSGADLTFAMQVTTHS